MNQIIKQYIELGRVLNVKYEDIAGQFPNRQQTVVVNVPEHAELVKHPFTAEEALALHKAHRNWATVARLMGKRKADVMAMVKAQNTKVIEPKTPKPAPISVMEATKKALSSKRYLTMKEVVTAVKAQNTAIPVFSNTVEVYVNTLVRHGQAKRRHEVSKLTGYKLAGC